MSTLVLLHAFGSSGRAWSPQVAELSPRHRVLTPDLPGHGSSPGPFSLDAAVRSVRELLAAEEQVHLVGISGSVSVALLTALAEPEKVASLVLSGGVAAPTGGDGLQRTVMGLLPAGMIVSMMKGMYSGGRPEHTATAAEDLRTAGKAALLTGLRELGELDLRPRLAEIKAPALVLVGEKDKANIAPAEVLAAGLPQAELRVIPGAGHIWNLEQPELFTRLATDWAGVPRD
ncbi:alpha/beta fold hydrolase [Nonomuraea sp. NPDC050394]|uniref:alpha/beta fold hydrolase n=1 Tax=Nonomuraea sp. NPDC050394 TaxID=3364363 RepID=UPI0037A83408